MASIAAQLKDMFFVLVERVTGYGRDENQKNSAGAKEATRTEEVAAVERVVIRARSVDPTVSAGSQPGVV
ncbi:hypothetical protein SETIT_7G257200v2 [Setaria italica]|uniref:Uncharacterized protein n=1 Tax=Setaria italica TaxID=4555 RepID=K3YCR0_SETIT|nr:hypothetical protein SETIT_7G257200v2 [Setaria italica]